jgi:site-specific recombinase XerD
MRKRYQQGSVTKSSDGRYWIGKYREGGRHKTKLLGKIREITKSKALETLQEITKPLNERDAISPNCTLKSFIEVAYFPFYQRKWKTSTLMTNRDRVRREIIGKFGEREMRTLTRDELQDFLDSKSSLSFSIVAHLRWDFRQIFEMAVSEGVVARNPALLLFTPRQSRKPNHRAMTVDEVKRALAALELRERLIVKLAILAGLRPGEIFGLRRGRIAENVADIQERVYRGRLDTPKTQKSIRFVALSASVRQDLNDWLEVSPASDPEAWIFPSERLSTPLSKENAMYRYIRPRLKKEGLGWVNFQVMRRTHSSLMRELGVDPKVVADLMGHDVDVNLNVYTQTSLDSRFKAVETLESAFVN